MKRDDDIIVGYETDPADDVMPCRAVHTRSPSRLIRNFVVTISKPYYYTHVFLCLSIVKLK